MGTNAKESGDDKFSASFAATRTKAEQGDWSAQLYLGGIYYRGNRFVGKDRPEAMKWYARAANSAERLAKQGDAKAQYKLGWLHEMGYGIEKNREEAENWYRKAAKTFADAAQKGDAESQTYIGLMYADGRGVNTDYGKALKWLREAANQGDPAARLLLSIFCDEWTEKVGK